MWDCTVFMYMCTHLITEILYVSEIIDCLNLKVKSDSLISTHMLYKF